MTQGNCGELICRLSSLSLLRPPVVCGTAVVERVLGHRGSGTRGPEHFRAEVADAFPE